MLKQGRSLRLMIIAKSVLINMEQRTFSEVCIGWGPHQFLLTQETDFDADPFILASFRKLDAQDNSPSKYKQTFLQIVNMSEAELEGNLFALHVVIIDCL